MPKNRRRTGEMIVSAILAILMIMVFVDGVEATETKITFATAYAPKTNLDNAANMFAENVDKRTEGRIKIIHYGAGSLYGFKDMLPAISKNQVNMALMHVAMVGSRSAALEFISSFGAQGCWSSYDHYYRFIDQPEVRSITDSEISQYFNSKLLGFWAVGGAVWGRTDKTITSIDDLKGMKFRVSGNAMATLFKALGAVPIDISSSEIYTALQRGTIQGFATSIGRVRRAKFYEVAPYITEDPTMPFISNYLAINKDTWESIAPKDQEIMIDESRKMESYTREKAMEEYVSELAILKKSAKEVYKLSPEEIARFVQTAKTTMKEHAKSRLDENFDLLWGLLEKTQ